MCPAGHQRMSIKDRSENSVAGFVLLDLFKLLSRITAARPRVPQTACFLAPQTKENLQHATCLTVMTICYTKATQGDYWRSANRVSEISIEKFFGRLRAQAYARGCGHVGEARRQQAANKPEKYSVQKLPPLTPDEFRECCEHGYKAALRLAAFSSGLDVAKLEEMYQKDCSDGGMEFDWQSLQAHPAEAEDDEMGMMEETEATMARNARTC